MQVVSVVGRSNSGKTQLITQLIPELKLRGYRIGVIKHTHHRFDIDRSGKDSWKHQQAGADTVMIASPEKFALMKTTESEMPLDDLLAYTTDLDLIITEGYKRESRPKIEVFREELGQPPLFSGHPDLIAMISQTKPDPCVPCFNPDNISDIADFIESHFSLNKSHK